jgi:hypothetical protein
LIIQPWFTPGRWHPGRSSFILAGEIGTEKVYRMSTSVRERQRSVLLHHYLRCAPHGIEHHCERIELGLFTRDEMTLAFEFADMQVQCESEGLMGLYIGRPASEVCPDVLP